MHTAKGKSNATSSGTLGRESSSSSFPSSGWDYEVFLSFRGEETRKSFTNHLYNALVNRGIRTFIDNKELPKGEKIDPALRSAIHQSKIAIPIFSEGYATSKWCLRELAEIVECMKKEGERQITVIPVFYHVDPSDVRHQTGSYETAFQKHEKKFSQETAKWKKALKEVGELSGWNLDDIADGHEGELIKLIAKKVWSELRKSPLHVSDNLVGIQFHVEEMMKFLSIGSNDIRIVGILGLGGIGKTTIARCVYNNVYDQFDGCSYLTDARETLKTKGPIHMQSQLLDNILDLGDPNISSVDQGFDMIRQRLSSKRVLVVFDDVDFDINEIIGKREWFGFGSRIIITTRDKDILNLLQAYRTYEPQEMDFNQSLQLFSKHAFKMDQPPENYLDLSKEVVKTTGGLPLALEVIGSSLFCTEKSAWNAMVRKLKIIPNYRVQEKLRISYEGLDPITKEMFLDIACFFVGMDKNIVCYIWDGPNLFPEIGIDVLCRKSLIKIGENNELRMHDQLRALGREIVRQNNPNPEKRSMWSEQDVWDELCNQKGTGKVEGLCIDLNGQDGQRFLINKGFATIKVDNVLVARNFVRSFSELRWLRLQRCPIEFTPANLKKLAVLDLSFGTVTAKWRGWNYIQVAETLKALDLSYSVELSETPRFPENLQFEVLILQECTNLVTIDTSIGRLKRLVMLNMNGCMSLEYLPTSICKLRSLKRLDIRNTKIRRLPEKLGLLGALTELLIDGTLIERLPNSMGNLGNLQTLSLVECCKLQSLPMLPSSLKSLNACSCTMLQSLPELPSSLKSLGVSGCAMLQALPELPSCWKSLDFSGCEMLQSLPGLPSCLKSLDVSGCAMLQSLPGLPSCLKSLDVSGCAMLQSIPKLPSSLKSLDVSGCEMLQSLPELPSSWKSLDLSGCAMLQSLPRLPSSLKFLDVSGCTMLQSLPELPSSLESFDASGCAMKSLPTLSNLTNLKVLCLNSCENLVEISITINALESLSFSGCLALKSLDLKRCENVREISAFSCMRDLVKLRLVSCNSMAEIEFLDGLDSLQLLEISHCISLSKLPKLQGLKNLRSLKFFALGLSEIENLDGLDSLQLLEIRDCSSLSELPKLQGLKILRSLKLSAVGLSEIESLDGLDSLQLLEIVECSSLSKLPKLQGLKNLRTLKLFAVGLSEIESLEGLRSMKTLIIGNCSSLEKVPNLSKNLVSIQVKCCSKLSEIKGLKGLNSLVQLDLTQCESLTKIQLPKKLRKLCIDSCQNLSEIEGLKDLKSLEEMTIRDHPSELRHVSTLENLKYLELSQCHYIERLPDLSNLNKLNKLVIQGCGKLIEIPSVDGLDSLKELQVCSCKSLEILPNLSNLAKLQTFRITDCEKLTKIQEVDSLDIPKESSINKCISAETLPCLTAVDCKKLMENQSADGLGSFELNVRGSISMKFQYLSSLWKLRTFLLALILMMAAMMILPLNLNLVIAVMMILLYF